MLKIKVKAGNITNLTDARYFAAREVEWIGFPIGSGQGMIEAVKVKAIAEWLDGVKIVGEFNFNQPTEIISLNQHIVLDAVQVGMFISKKEIKQLEGLTVIKEVIVDIGLSEKELNNHLEVYANDCNFFLLNFSASRHITWQGLIKGYPYTIDFLKNLCHQYPIILNLDCQKDEVNQMIAELTPHAIGLNGSEEEKVGFKSFDDLDEILDELEIE